MKNPYAAGFYALLAALLVICGAVFWAGFNSDKPNSTQDAFAFINSISALFQALAAGVVAALAYKGLTSWKQELNHSKAYGVVWDANVAFRKIEASIERLTDQWSRYCPPMRASIVIDAVNKDPINTQFKEFIEHCQILDKVVVKTGWEWAERAEEMQAALDALAVEVHKPPLTDTQVLTAKLTAKTQESVDKAVERVESAMSVIEAGLRVLDQKYS